MKRFFSTGLVFEYLWLFSVKKHADIQDIRLIIRTTDNIALVSFDEFNL